jgi:hypothetical protein
VFRKLSILMMLLLIVSSAVFAQTEEPAAPVETEEAAGTEEPGAPVSTEEASATTGEEVATGLNNPRGIFVAADGTLYITEAGTGGDVEAMGPFGPGTAGQTGQISVVSPEGEQSVLVSDIVSLDAGFGQIEGVMAVYATDTSLWVVYGLGPQGEENPFEGTIAESVVEHDLETLEVLQTIDLRAFEAENNPDEAEEVVSNPADIAVAEDSTIYIADASGNSVVKWTAEGGAELFAAWPVVEDELSAVPTAVSVGPDGDIYVGFLSGFPYPPGAARVERYSPEGELEETYGGLTLVTDIYVDEEGTVYALEMAEGFGDTGFIPNSGRVVIASAEGVEPVVENLNVPYGFTQDADGNWLISVNAVAQQEAGAGSVIRLSAES